MSELPRLGLCMIVKNEEHCIERCLESVSKYINYWVICDTGSTDNTKEIINEFFAKKGIPGEVVDIPWEGFGASRSKAISCAEGKMEYALMIDADDSIEGDFRVPDFGVPVDGYSLKIQRGDFTWYRNQIFRLESKWRFEGVLHEYAVCEAAGNAVCPKLSGSYHIEARTEGGRNLDITPQEKYLKDAEVLFDALTNEKSPHYQPENSRYMFYLAQSYFDSGEYEIAMEWYLKRCQAGGWEEEVFYSMYRVGICNVLLERPWNQIQDAFLQCWAYRPCRIEPLWQLSRLYRNNGNPRLAYLFANQGLQVGYPEDDILFIAHDLWEWQILDEVAATAYYVHEFEKGLAASNMLMNNPKFPKEHHARTLENIKLYKEAIERKSLAEKERDRRVNKFKGKEVPSTNQKTQEKKSFKKRKKQKARR
tara:strand:- start:1137 stop:2402 length:1266 start_codon:yes stop_codon:yes gene_type:complete